MYYSEKYWGGFKDIGDDRSVTAGSIVYWAKQYWKLQKGVENQFDKIRKDTLDNLINQTMKQPCDFDLAKVLYQFCKHQYVCVDIKNSMWYEFKNHHFNESDSAVTLNLTGSTQIHAIYFNRMMEHMKLLSDYDNQSKEWGKIQEEIKTLSKICDYWHENPKKEKIMREAKLLFYDKEFLQRLDEDHKLMACNNGVIDFHHNIFRPGDTSDYISKTTKINYIPAEKMNPTIRDDINDFMRKLFPVPDLLEYMWEMLASCLIGNNKNQLFHIFCGGGSNGKSLLVLLMKQILGEYYGIVPGGIITDKKTKIGGVSPEIMELKGKRLAVINEPSKGEKINEGPLKALTGGDDIQGRSLFKNTVTFKPSFKLIVCTNVLYDIDATDEGTWRRIRVVPFMSYFTDNPDPTKDFEFQKDIELEDKMLKDWIEPFFSMLVDVAFRTGGSITKKCDIVTAKSAEYRNTQDHIMNFISEKIKESPGDKVKKGELQREFEDWFKMQYGNLRSAPKMKELYPIMNKKFGEYRNLGWHNITIVQEDNDEDDEY
jgi:P4 family phage/plasmid primase-like protien